MSQPRSIPPQCLELITRYEGFSAVPYKDPLGILTCGYGHVILPDEHFDTLTEEQGRELLMRDAQLRASWIPVHIHVSLNDNRFSAVLSLVFNMGTAPLVGHLGTYLNESRFQDAADEFPRWVYAGHRKLPGLVARREAERELFLGSVSV